MPQPQAWPLFLALLKNSSPCPSSSSLGLRQPSPFPLHLPQAGLPSLPSPPPSPSRSSPSPSPSPQHLPGPQLSSLLLPLSSPQSSEWTGHLQDAAASPVTSSYVEAQLPHVCVSPTALSSAWHTE